MYNEIYYVIIIQGVTMSFEIMYLNLLSLTEEASKGRARMAKGTFHFANTPKGKAYGDLELHELKNNVIFCINSIEEYKRRMAAENKELFKSTLDGVDKATSKEEVMGSDVSEFLDRLSDYI